MSNADCLPKLISMIGWTILAIGFLFIITLRGIVAKSLPRFQRPRSMTLLLLSTFFGGGVLTIISSQVLTNAIHRKDWPIAQGRVIKAEAITSSVIKPMVIYAYVVGEKAYVDTTDLQVPGFGNRSKQFEVVEKLVLEYPVGKEIIVHYNPVDFSESVLVVTPRWNTYGQIGLGLIMFSASLFFLILPRPTIVVRQL